MPNVINNQTTQVNLVLVPEKVIDIYNLKIDKIKTKLDDIFPESKPIITQFPELVLIFEPNNQISISLIKENNRIIIADNRITPYTARELTIFLKFAKECSDIIISDNPVKNYGFNVVSIFDIEGQGIDSGKLLKEKFLQLDAITPIFGDIENAGVKLVYKADQIRHEIRFEPRYGTDLEPTNAIVLNLNAHFIGTIPSLTELTTKCQKIYESLATNLTKLFV